ncbi:MAG TPA: potassium-transporting ATPase subunit KdpC [Streptosporangiaceae bacterium]|jgi:K+-transporting ATPase ATPase C chain|nr:potassium-transporting ATPase subunit KdpC [Streptosporangiaceae bacterium]HEX2822943.1 potassium-transporting ATPase subunit KdpC [Streptosporangiaceae bacterium]
MNRLPVIVRQHIAGFRFLLVFTVVCGFIYPLVMLGVSQLAFHNQANGSLVSYNGHVVGSSLLCQEFVDAKGNPLPQWFQPRPSDAIPSPAPKGDYGCDPTYSAASNLGPTNPTEIADIEAQQKAISAFDHVPVSQIPADAVTASGSGLDPDISPANAYMQVDRVAAARHLPVAEVRALVAKFVQGRTLGFLGEPRVDVLTLNIALAELSAKSGS